MGRGILVIPSLVSITSNPCIWEIIKDSPSNAILLTAPDSFHRSAVTAIPWAPQAYVSTRPNNKILENFPANYFLDFLTETARNLDNLHVLWLDRQLWRVPRPKESTHSLSCPFNPRISPPTLPRLFAACSRVTCQHATLSNSAGPRPA
jgi:hypothetical protein